MHNSGFEATPNEPQSNDRAKEQDERRNTHEGAFKSQNEQRKKAPERPESQNETLPAGAFDEDVERDIDEGKENIA